MNKLEISHVETVIVDLPLKRLQRFSALGSHTQSVVMVFVQTAEGVQGIGESVTPSGPWWSGESVETIKVIIDTYLAPLLIGANTFDLTRLMAAMDKQVYANRFAKAGVEMALLDAVGKALNVPVHTLFGGKVRDSLPVAWPLATGDPEQEIGEAEQMLADGYARNFKLKMGAVDADTDVARALRIARALEGRARVRVDPNESWDEATAARAIPQLADGGIEMVEQPLPRWNLAGSARLTAASRIPVMLDESICTSHEMQEAARLHAGSIVSLKIMKAGGMRATRTMADIAMSAGVTLYMGTFLESSFGTGANMQLCATLADLPLGGELVGPLLLAEDICERRAEYRDYCLWLQDGVGLGVSVDADKLKAFRRDRTYSSHAADSTTRQAS